MTGVEIAVGFLFAWAMRKARRVAGRVDAEVDRGLDVAMDRLHDVVSTRLGQDSALERLNEEAGSGELAGRTRQRVELALEDAVERDAAFAELLRSAVAEVQAASADGSTFTFHGPAAVQTGDHNRQENHFGTSA